MFDNPEMSVLETVRHELIIDEGTARNILAGFMFRRGRAQDGEKPPGELSWLKLCLLMQQDVNP